MLINGQELTTGAFTDTTMDLKRHSLKHMVVLKTKYNFRWYTLAHDAMTTAYSKFPERGNPSSHVVRNNDSDPFHWHLLFHHATLPSDGVIYDVLRYDMLGPCNRIKH